VVKVLEEMGKYVGLIKGGPVIPVKRLKENEYENKSCRVVFIRNITAVLLMSCQKTTTQRLLDANHHRY